MSLPSLRSIFAQATNLLSQLRLGGQAPSSSSYGDITPPYQAFDGAPSCPIDGPVSCHNSTPAGDSCCFVYPGGKMLLTQFWDSQVHSGGSEEDWTVHGLWPDLCDGTYDQFCHMTPSFNNITAILKHHNQYDLLAFMDRHWPAAYGPSAKLWEHEFNKHGTCINTLAPSCYGAQYHPGLEVVDYFSRAVALFRQLDTYRALEAAGITPHVRTRYPLVDVQGALERFSGGRVVLRCTGGRRDVLHEAWYVYFVKGSLQSGQFVPARDGQGRENDAGNCAPWVRYPPKRKKGWVL